MLNYRKLFPASFIAAGILSAASVNAVEIDPERSLFITDKAILNQFPMHALLQQLLDEAGDTSQQPIDLISAMINARLDPGRTTNQTDLALSAYTPIAITNRFDLANEASGHCGEYRIAYRADLGTGDEVFMIFESRLQSPNNDFNLEDCRPVADFWANLSFEDDILARAAALKDFYFNGLPNFDPILKAENFAGGNQASGQIRFNVNNGTGRNWDFREVRAEVSANNTIEIFATTTKDNVIDALAVDTNANDDNIDDALAELFQSSVLQSLSTNGEKLLANSMSTLSIDLPNEVLAMSDAAGNAPSAGVTRTFDSNSNFATDIETALANANSSLTPSQVMARVQALSCAGCHNIDENLGGELSGFKTFFQGVEFLSAGPTVASDATVFKMEAENWLAMEGIKTENTSDIGGGLNVGWINDGDSLTYAINNLPPSIDNLYQVSFRIAGENSASARIEFPDERQSPQTFFASATGGWQEWQTVTSIITIPNGVETFTLRATSDDWNINWVEIRPAEKFLVKDSIRDVFLPERKTLMEAFLNACISNCAEPILIQAENFNAEQGVQTEGTSDVGGGLNVGWFDAGDWLSYGPVNIPTSGDYVVEYRVASNAGGGSLQIEQAGGFPVFGSIQVPDTGGWQNWTTISHTITLEAGVQNIGLSISDGGWNLNWFRISPAQ